MPGAPTITEFASYSRDMLHEFKRTAAACGLHSYAHLLELAAAEAERIADSGQNAPDD
jgi:hypothetical protein